jgi:rubrerythrin
MSKEVPSLIQLPTQLPRSRRDFLLGTGAATLSATAVALLAGVPTASFAGDMGAAAGSGDVAILNVALGLEHEGIAAYQIGAESGLLKKPALDVAVLFQSHHKEHRDALIATIQKLGGKPVEALPQADYAKSAKLNVAAIKNDVDVLKLAQRLELGAVNAYLGVIPAFGNKDLAKVSGRLAADEAMHYTALSQALNDMLPAKALSFGA